MLAYILEHGNRMSWSLGHATLATNLKRLLVLTGLLLAGCSSLCGKCAKDGDCDDGQSCRDGTCSYTTGNTQCCNGSPCDEGEN